MDMLGNNLNAIIQEQEAIIIVHAIALSFGLGGVAEHMNMPSLALLFNQEQ
jgi:hypothetical protein